MSMMDALGDTESVKKFLEKLKDYIGKKFTCVFVNADGEACPESTATHVILTICDKSVTLCLNPIKGAIIGYDDDGEAIYAEIVDGDILNLAEALECCAQVAFTNAAGEPVDTEDGASFVTITVDGQPVTICLDKPVHVQVPEGEDPAVWIAANYADYPADSHFYTGDDPLNPTGVWNVTSTGDILCDKRPQEAEPVHVQVPEGEDPAVWIAANYADYPADSHFYTGDDPLNPTGVWNVTSTGDILCDKRPQEAAPIHVQVPEGEDPATWIAANAGDYPAGTHFYTGDDPLAPTGVWTIDANGDILCDKAPNEAAPIHVQVPEGEDPAVWIAANYADYPADSHFYTGDDPLNPTGVWNVTSTGDILCDKRPQEAEPVHVQVPDGEDPAVWIAANYADYPADSHFYTGDDPLNPTGVWNVDATGSILCDKDASWTSVLREDCDCPSGRGGTTGVGDGKVIRDISVDANGELVIDQVYDHTAITVSSPSASVVISAQDIPRGFTDSGAPICIELTNNSCRTMTGTLWVEGQLDVSTNEGQCANVEAVVKADRGNGNLANFVNRDVNINITCPHPGESNISNVVSLNKPSTVTLAGCQTKTVCVQLCIEVKQAFSGSIASNVRIRYQGTTR